MSYFGSVFAKAPEMPKFFGPKTRNNSIKNNINKLKKRNGSKVNISRISRLERAVGKPTNRNHGWNGWNVKPSNNGLLNATYKHPPYAAPPSPPPSPYKYNGPTKVAPRSPPPSPYKYNGPTNVAPNSASRYALPPPWVHTSSGHSSRENDPYSMYAEPNRYGGRRTRRRNTRKSRR